MTESIDWVQSSSGHSVPRQAGNFLCSSVDPKSEGEKWARTQIKIIGDAQLAFVLGLGGGFHVQALQELVPELRLIVIESHRVIFDRVMIEHPELVKRSQIIVGLDAEKLSEFAAMKEALNEKFVILSHKSSVRLNRSFYDPIKDYIGAKTITGLDLHLKARPELRVYLKQLSLPSDRPLNVVEVAESIHRKGGPLDSQSLFWLTLRELVK